MSNIDLTKFVELASSHETNKLAKLLHNEPDESEERETLNTALAQITGQGILSEEMAKDLVDALLQK